MESNMNVDRKVAQIKSDHCEIIAISERKNPQSGR